MDSLSSWKRTFASTLPRRNAPRPAAVTACGVLFAAQNPLLLAFGLPGWAAPLLWVSWLLLAGSLALVVTRRSHGSGRRRAADPALRP